jgi:hypothetical protein
MKIMRTGPNETTFGELNASIVFRIPEGQIAYMKLFGSNNAVDLSTGVIYPLSPLSKVIPDFNATLRSK